MSSDLQLFTTLRNIHDNNIVSPEISKDDKMISVWCSDDRHRSLTQAKNGQNLPERECETPVMTHYELGNQIGISGTPALIFPDGRVIPGYMDVERLVAMLNIN